MTDQKFLQTITSFAAQKGYIWGPSPEIYGGLSGFYTYGPLGKLLKNNVENSIRRNFQKYSFFEVECPTVLPEKVWEASGHLGGFTDPLIKCSKCKNSFRADHIAETVPGYVPTTDKDKLIEFTKQAKCPSCKGEFQEKIVAHNLMMKTTVGLDTTAFNRPETATATYLPFPRYADFFRNKLPFGVFQIGKAYRNEISPRQFLLRMREFTQAEAQFFIHPDQKKVFENFEEIKDIKVPIYSAITQEKDEKIENITFTEILKKKYMVSQAYAWTVYIAYKQFIDLGIPNENIRLRQHLDDEKAFYAEDAWDIEIKLNSFGWTEVCGVHDRTDYDLNQHEKFSKTKLNVTMDDGSKIKPHVLEIAFGTDRPVYALLDNFYEKKDEKEGKSIFKIPYHLSPIQVGVLPLMKKPELQTKAKEIFNKLQTNFITKYDESQSIGKRYLRAAEEAIPFCITVDFDTLENNTITIRDRDTEKQKLIPTKDLINVLEKLLSREIMFKDLEYGDKK